MQVKHCQCGLQVTFTPDIPWGRTINYLPRAGTKCPKYRNKFSSQCKPYAPYELMEKLALFPLQKQVLQVNCSYSLVLPESISAL